MELYFPFGVIAPVATWVPSVAVILVGGLVGIGSMLIYWRLSPQQSLVAVTRQASDARKALQTFDGDELDEYRRLTLRALGCSLQQLKLVLLPTLAAMLPVLGLAYLLEHSFELGGRPLWSGEVTWINSMATAFWVALCVAAVVVKFRFKIK